MLCGVRVATVEAWPGQLGYIDHAFVVLPCGPAIRVAYSFSGIASLCMLDDVCPKLKYFGGFECI